MEECKEAILELSGREETFFGPYEMPLLKVVFANDNEEEEGAEAQPEDANTSQARRHMTPSEESLEMLTKLEPLPTLLEDFDLDAHVD